MRAVAILGPGCSAKDIKPFQTENPVDWRIGVPPPADEVDAVLLFGGDGTIHRHLHPLVQLGVPVLVVPAGSGNDFARGLGFRTVRDSLVAWRRFCAGDGNLRTIDLGTISPLNKAADGASDPSRVPKHFCTVAGVGLDGEVARRANTLPRWLRGHGGYVLSFALAAVRYAPLRMKIFTLCDSGAWTVHRDQPALLAAFANTAIYGGGMKIAPPAKVDDGLLDVCVVTGLNMFKLFCMFPTVYFGRHLQVRGVSHFQTSSARIETAIPLDVYADGEFVCQTPVEIGVQPAALKVLSP